MPYPEDPHPLPPHWCNSGCRRDELEQAAYERGLEDGAKPFDFDGECDAYYNLEGALTDLRRERADKICIETIERVQGQIAELYKLVRALKQQKEIR